MQNVSIFDEEVAGFGDIPPPEEMKASPPGYEKKYEKKSTAQAADDDRRNDDIYKKWYRTSSKSGFLSLRPWLQAGKLSVDIGETSGDGGLQGNTLVWTDAIELAVYLQAVYDGHAERLYPTRKDTPTDESYVYYGGGKVDGKPVSRILKVHYWKTGENSYDPGSFVWKAGHFAAKQTASGAFIPDTSQMLSVNTIKVRRIEMAEMSYRLNLALQSFAATDDHPFEALNGTRR